MPAPIAEVTKSTSLPELATSAISLTSFSICPKSNFPVAWVMVLVPTLTTSRRTPARVSFLASLLNELKFQVPYLYRISVLHPSLPQGIGHTDPLESALNVHQRLVVVQVQAG